MNENEKITEIPEEAEEFDILDVLLDEDNDDAIDLVDCDGQRIAFEQIAVVPYDDKIYCLLRPIDHVEGVAEDECIVFYVVEEEGKKPVLAIEEDLDKMNAVYNEYVKLAEEEGIGQDEDEKK